MQLHPASEAKISVATKKGSSRQAARKTFAKFLLLAGEKILPLSKNDGNDLEKEGGGDERGYSITVPKQSRATFLFEVAPNDPVCAFPRKGGGKKGTKKVPAREEEFVDKRLGQRSLPPFLGFFWRRK